MCERVRIKIVKIKIEDNKKTEVMVNGGDADTLV